MTSEEDLIRRARRFEQGALAEIYDHYSPGVYRYAARLLGDTQLAEDCVSDTFLRYLYALRAGGGPRDHLQAYLYRIAHNWITDQYRRQPPPQLPLHDELPDGEEGLLQAVVKRIDQIQVRGALACLTPDQRQVIVLKYLEGWENESVARALEKPVGSIKSLQHRALEALRRMLLPHKEEMYG
ncbi:MAG: sigma-70 family RNA polymerase sigma factor [Chloroflexi bacterium]|nr:sigma-70 family RNA polymerase sigma factor [Chloroflexota bacterium]